MRKWLPLAVALVLGAACIVFIAYRSGAPDPIVDLTRWLAVFTAFLVVTGGLQWWILREQVDTTRALERPWLIVEASASDLVASFPRVLDRPEPATLPDGHTIGRVRVSSSNHGRSPAWLTSGCIHFRVLALPLPPEPPYEVRQFALTAVAPKALDDDPMVVGLTVSAGEVQDVWAERSCIVLFGCSNYRDIFGQAHQTRYAWTWKRVPSDPGQRVIEVAREVSPNWNRYT